MIISGMDAAQVTLQIGSDKQSAVSVSLVSQKINAHERGQVSTQEKAAPQQAEDTKQYQTNERVVSEAVNKLNKALEGTNRRMEYTVHERTNGIIITVIDETTGEVIREVPPKKILDMVANMMELAGLLVDERR